MNDRERTTGFVGTTVLILIIVAGAFVLMMILGMFPLHNPYGGKPSPTTLPAYPRCATPPRTPSPGFCIRPDGHLVLVDGYGNVTLWK